MLFICKLVKISVLATYTQKKQMNFLILALEGTESEGMSVNITVKETFLSSVDKELFAAISNLHQANFMPLNMQLQSLVNYLTK